MKAFLRWALLLPAAALAAGLASIAVPILGNFSMGSRFSADPHSLYISFAQGGVMGMVFVAIGRALAPTRKLLVSWLLVALTAVLSGLVTLSAADVSRWISLTSSVLMVITAFATAWLQRQPKSDTKSKNSLAMCWRPPRSQHSSSRPKRAANDPTFDQLRAKRLHQKSTSTVTAESPEFELPPFLRAPQAMTQRPKATRPSIE